jgi:hypothetical protein
MSFLSGVWGRRGMSLEFFDDRPIKVAHCKPKKKPWETFVFSATWQPFKLININRNKYPSSCKVLSQNWWWTKLGIEILLKQWHEAKCSQECASKIFP